MMNFKPDLNIEYDYVKVVFEVTIYELRSNKKILEKELKTIIMKTTNLKKKLTSNTADVESSLKTLIKKAKELKKKFQEICIKENFLYNTFNERLEQLELINKSKYSMENLKLFCDKKMNNLLTDYFLRENFLETAKNFIDEEKIKFCIEYSIFMEIQNILNSIRNKDLSEALKWCNLNKSKLSKINSKIKFKIISQMYIEKYKENKFIECVELARQNFKEFRENTKEIGILMTFLSIPPNSNSFPEKYQHYISEERWKELENDFKLIFFQLYSMKSISLLEIIVQSGIISLKTPFCFNKKKCIQCPICSEDIGALASDLPFCNHSISNLICRITKEIMDFSNPPLALPNGQVYSQKAINEQMAVNKKFVCPITKNSYTKEDFMKVFVC